SFTGTSCARVMPNGIPPRMETVLILVGDPGAGVGSAGAAAGDEEDFVDGGTGARLLAAPSALGLRITSMMAGDIPPLASWMTPLVDKSKFVLDALIWLMMVPAGTLASAMSKTL